MKLLIPRRTTCSIVKPSRLLSSCGRRISSLERETVTVVMIGDSYAVSLKLIQYMENFGKGK
ncbi:MAG: hypothetical protein LZF86_190128 [Nitrospira sp.]|nr:MAG: hypothetical protein LZF86_190128 [Nitrospira sp.]